MGCCASSLKLKELNLNSSIYLAAGGSGSRSQKRLYSSRNSSGVGSSSSSSSTSSSSNSNRSIWSRSSQPICDDFAEQPAAQLERSCGYHTCSSANSSPRKSHQEEEEEEEVLMRTQDMSDSNSNSNSLPSQGNLEWEMYMMQQAQRIMPKTSSPISQRRGMAHLPPPSSYQKWRNYLQSTPAHMLHNVTHIPEAIAGHFCPTGFPGFSDLEEMESAAKRYKVDQDMDRDMEENEPLYTTYQLLAGHTHTISTDL
ncbi:vitellogenin-1 [Drosophila takahashii]|uniref:vitellogenin-1 n=1 Tax=Drosophila takahashii TaxID=29030 RepID=UPI001CF8DFD3|nr:uncharacterized protein DDB_G0271670 [Drosophila takahashii]